MGLPTPRPITLGIGFGLEGPRKREGKEEVEGQRKGVKRVGNDFYYLTKIYSSARALGGHLAMSFVELDQGQRTSNPTQSRVMRLGTKALAQRLCVQVKRGEKS